MKLFKFNPVFSVVFAAFLLCACSKVEMTPGIYNGTAKGHNAPLNVEVTVSEHAIEAISVKEHKETPGVSTPAFKNVLQAILDNQSVDVDAVSGATVTSNALIEAVTKALEQTGADMSFFTKSVERKVKGKKIKKTADVVVIGAGGAGCAAAVQAHQCGASVIIIDKMAAMGGNTILAGGIQNAVKDGSAQAIANNDSQEKFFQQTISGGDYQGDTALVRILTSQAWDALEWQESIGMKFGRTPSSVPGSLGNRGYGVQGGANGYFVAYGKYFESNENIELMLSTKALDLIEKNGRVVGVKCSDDAGNDITLMANKGVVIATGGFGQNVAMRQKYNEQWEDLGESVKSTNSPAITGDGIVMAEKVGADLVQMGNIQLLPHADPETGRLGNIAGASGNGIFINKEGNRFVNEAGRRDEMSHGTLAQTDGVMWIVVGGFRGFGPGFGGAGGFGGGDSENGDASIIFHKTDNTITAQTIEGLAEGMGVPVKNLKAAIADYNKRYLSTKPDKFGRDLFLSKIEPPYTAQLRKPAVHHTMGGLRIDTDTHVLDKDGNAIPGLYAAGEVTGGIHGTNRLGGNALSEIVVFGRIAGRNAAGGK